MIRYIENSLGILKVRNHFFMLKKNCKIHYKNIIAPITIKTNIYLFFALVFFSFLIPIMIFGYLIGLTENHVIYFAKMKKLVLYLS